MSMDGDEQGNPPSDGNRPPLPLPRFRMPAFVAKKLPRWKRKLKKLKRDPRAFLHDSALGRLLIKPSAVAESSDVAGARKIRPQGGAPLSSAVAGLRKASAVAGPRVLLAD